MSARGREYVAARARLPDACSRPDALAACTMEPRYRAPATAGADAMADSATTLLPTPLRDRAYGDAPSGQAAGSARRPQRRILAGATSSPIRTCRH
jgi:hypothetical protein